MTNIHNQDWLINNTIAGEIAKKLDANDGTKDNKISGSVWNKFVEEIGTGKKISEGGSISVFNALISITTYAVRAGKAKADEIANGWKQNLGNASADDVTETDDSDDVVRSEAEEAPASTRRRGQTQNGAVSDAEMKANIQKDYSSIRVTLKAYNVVGQKPDATKVNKIKQNKASGEKVANAIIKANNEFCKTTTLSNLNKIRSALSQINSDNVIYVLRKIPNLAELIDGVNFAGHGLDKEDVYKYVMEPLGKKCNVKFNKNASLSQMADTATKYAKQEREKDNNVIKKYNKGVHAYNDSVKAQKAENASLASAANAATKAGTVLARAANMPDIIQETAIEPFGDDSNKKATLKDGTEIVARYSSDGTLKYVNVTFSDGSCALYDDEGFYYSEGASKTDNNYDIKQQNIMQNLEAIIDKIFK